jgi:hypothetical protein
MEEVMKSRFTVSLAILAGVGIGAVAVQSLHAQSKPPVYFVGETEISNPDAYAKEYLPVVMADIKANGAAILQRERQLQWKESRRNRASW